MWNRGEGRVTAAWRSLPQTPQMWPEKIRTEFKTASISQNGIWRICTCSSGIPRSVGDESLKTSIPVIMMGVMVRRYTTRISMQKGNVALTSGELGNTDLIMKRVYSETCSVPHSSYFYGMPPILFMFRKKLIIINFKMIKIMNSVRCVTCSCAFLTVVKVFPGT